MDDTQRRRDDDTPETAEPPEAEELSEKVRDEARGEGDTTARLHRSALRRARGDRTG